MHEDPVSSARSDMPFFLPGTTRCALTGQPLHQRSHATQLIQRVPDLFGSLVAPASEWVDRSAWDRWEEAAPWVEASTELVVRSYADSPHRATAHGVGLVRVTGPQGGALIDIARLWRLSFPDDGDELRVAVEQALGGGVGLAKLGGGLTLRLGGGRGSLEQDGGVVETGWLPAERLAAWRTALLGERGGAPVPQFSGEGATHRLLASCPGGSAALVGRLRVELAAVELAAGTHLRVLGGQDTVEGAEVWLEGDLGPWRALAALGIGPAPLHGLTGEVHVESRALAYLDELRRDDRPWPITWSGGGPVGRVRPRGNTSPGQLRLLAEHLDAAFGAGTAAVRGSEVVVRPSAEPERTLELVLLWAQRAWVEPQVIEAVE